MSNAEQKSSAATKMQPGDLVCLDYSEVERGKGWTGTCCLLLFKEAPAGNLWRALAVKSGDTAARTYYFNAKNMRVVK